MPDLRQRLDRGVAALPGETIFAADQDNRELRWCLRNLAVDAYDRTAGGLIAAGLLTRTTRRRLIAGAYQEQGQTFTTKGAARSGERAAAELLAAL